MVEVEEKINQFEENLVNIELEGIYKILGNLKFESDPSNLKDAPIINNKEKNKFFSTILEDYENNSSKDV